jgi:hypothetical protein
MKNIYFLVVGFTFSAAQSQEITDALRYSQDNLNGTARFRAMGHLALLVETYHL